MSNRVLVVPYDSAWPMEFSAEAERIHSALRGVSLAIHHIGSTAIPGIMAKPIIDILLEMEAMEALADPELSSDASV